jgi:hypothetical protein
MIILDKVTTSIVHRPSKWNLVLEKALIFNILNAFMRKAKKSVVARRYTIAKFTLLINIARVRKRPDRNSWLGLFFSKYALKQYSEPINPRRVNPSAYMIP